MSGPGSHLQVKDLMTREVFSLFAHNSVDVLGDLLSWQRIRHVPVVDESGGLLGIVTHRDLLRMAIHELSPALTKNLEQPPRVSVGEIMRKEVNTISSDAPLFEAAQILWQKKIGCLPVVDQGRLVGIITEADFVRAFFEWDVESVED